MIFGSIYDAHIHRILIIDIIKIQIYKTFQVKFIFNSVEEFHLPTKLTDLS